MSSNIHPMACVHPDAVIGENCQIDAFAVIEDHVKIGDNCHIHSHAKIARYTTMGNECRVYLGASVGENPQDHRCLEETVSYTEIGNHVILREYSTVHRPPFEGAKTVIGDHCLLMCYGHLGHDVILHDHVTIANGCSIAGHVEIFPGSVLSASILVHQFVRIGALTMICPTACVRQDVPPYCMLNDLGEVIGLNSVGIRRSGISAAARGALQRAVRTYYHKGLTRTDALAQIEEADGAIPEVRAWIDFIRSAKRGVVPAAHLVTSEETDD